MTRSQHPKKDDAGKTKQQLIDELQNEIAQLRHSEGLFSGIVDIATDAIISIDEQQCIVDDDSSMRRALGRMVKSFGFDVRLFASARECLNGSDIDLSACLILDVSMPAMDGFELHAQLVESKRSVPTVFISAHDDTHYPEKARSIGAIAFLNKTCDESLLLGAINKALAS